MANIKRNNKDKVWNTTARLNARAKKRGVCGGHLKLGEWGKNWARVDVGKPVVTVEKEIKNEEIKNWVVSATMKFYDTFKPELDRFVQRKSGVRAVHRSSVLAPLEK